MAIHAIENDEAHTPDADRFDGLRSFRTWEEEREKQMAGKSKASAININSGNPFLFETPTATSLNFGYGRTACPGRFFASHAIKMVLVKLFCDYEFQFLPGSGRPPNVMAHEFMFTSPEQKILVRRSRKALCPF
jgi:cytochrome P450